MRTFGILMLVITLLIATIRDMSITNYQLGLVIFWSTVAIIGAIDQKNK